MASANLLERSPPHSLEAERGVLGSLMVDSRLCDDLAGVLRADEFHGPANRVIFQAIVSIHEEGLLVDIDLLIERLKTRGELDRVGGLATLLDIYESQPTATNALWYARTVRDFAIKREAIAAAMDTLRDAYDPTIAAQDVLVRSGNRFGAIDERRTTTQVIDMETALPRVLEEIYARSENESIAGVSTPWFDLSRKIGCFRNGEFYILGARPGMGKTSIALGIAQRVAQIDLKPVLFISLEMSYAELCERMLSSRTAIHGEHIRDGRLAHDELKKLGNAANELSDMKLLIDDAPGRMLSDIAAQARSLKRKSRLTMLIIDHLGLITPDNPRDNRQEQVSRITRRLKLLAKELKVPVIALAQLNRETEKRTDHRPKLSDIRESGSAEQDAGVVMFIHREGEYRPNDPEYEGKAELIVSKNRSGKTGVVPLRWSSSTTSFSGAGKEWEGWDA